MLCEDLGEEALAWIEATNADLIRAPHKPARSVNRLDEELLDGDVVVLDEDD